MAPPYARPARRCKALEPLKKFRGHLRPSRESGLFDSWRRFGSVAGRCRPAPSPKPRQDSKILAPNGHRISLMALRDFQDVKKLRVGRGHGVGDGEIAVAIKTAIRQDRP